MPQADSAVQMWISKRSRLSTYVTLLEKQVTFSDERGTQVFHCFKCSDYIAVLALTNHKTVPLVSQFRPAVSTNTWELPAGLMGSSEDPLAAAKRELWEETGYVSQNWLALPKMHADTGRLDNRLWGFVALDAHFGLEQEADDVPTEGIVVREIPVSELVRFVLNGGISHAGHAAIAILGLLLTYPDFLVDVEW